MKLSVTTKIGAPTTDEERAAYAVYTTNIRIKVMENIFGPMTGTVIPGDSSQGYTGVYTNVAGKQFKEYKQDLGSWASIPYSEGTISNYGCSITAVSIALSGYGYTDDPGVVLSNNTTFGVSTALQKKGINCSYRNGNLNKDDIIEHLKKKKIVIVHVESPSEFTRSEHWMTILDVAADGRQVYVSNPNSAGTNGWVDINNINTLKDCLYLE